MLVRPNVRTYFAGADHAGVGEVGISNLVTFIQNTAPYRRILRRVLSIGHTIAFFEKHLK